MDAATRTLAEGRVVRVDAGEVNGRVFVNNSSLGLYPNIVVKRRRREKRGAGKWMALAWAVAAVVRRFPYLSVRLNADGRPATASTPFVFIGNNEYEVEGFNMGERARLDAGCGADVFLSGHLHLGLIGLSTVRYEIAGLSALIVQAGTATSARRRGEVNSFNILRTDRPDIELERINWDSEANVFAPAAKVRFRRSGHGWHMA